MRILVEKENYEKLKTNAGTEKTVGRGESGMDRALADGCSGFGVVRVIPLARMHMINRGAF
jgi:hypothetical protein